MSKVPDHGVDRLTKFKRSLVLQLVLRCGEFWDIVSEVRERNGIKPIVRMPESSDSSWEPLASDDQNILEHCIVEGLEELYHVTIPQSFRVLNQEPRSFQQWKDFLTASILFEPPEDQLLQFADYGGPRGVHLVGNLSEFLSDEPPEIPLIRDNSILMQRRESASVAAVEWRFWTKYHCASYSH